MKSPFYGQLSRLNRANWMIIPRLYLLSDFGFWVLHSFVLEHCGRKMRNHDN
jgi:hypothetical protein